MNLDNYPRVLIISDATWADDNNIGNTFTNLFLGWPKEKIAMIYARPNLPNTNVCNQFFQISETRLLKNIFNKDIKTGMKLNVSNKNCTKDHTEEIKKDEQTGKKIYNFFLRFRWNIFLSAREILWSISNWKNSDLDEYVDNFNPNIIISLADSSAYMNKIQQYVMKRSNAKSAIYFVDDVYSNKRFSLSPVFWINRQFSRKLLQKTVSLCVSVYTIVDKQKEEYDRLFNVESKILNKGGNFSDVPKFMNDKSDHVKLIYTGNITSGRWQTLAKIGRALDNINKSQTKATLSIYTKNKLYRKIDKAFQKIDSIEFMGSIDASQVKEVQNIGDILVHVESMKLKEKLVTRLSFSTKLVDYFERGKCILAIGWFEAASIRYLKENNAAYIISDLKAIEDNLLELINRKELISELGENAWMCGFRHHQIANIRNNLQNDLVDMLNPNK